MKVRIDACFPLHSLPGLTLRIDEYLSPGADPELDFGGHQIHSALFSCKGGFLTALSSIGNITDWKGHGLVAPLKPPLFDAFLIQIQQDNVAEAFPLIT